MGMTTTYEARIAELEAEVAQLRRDLNVAKSPARFIYEVERAEQMAKSAQLAQIFGVKEGDWSAMSPMIAALKEAARQSKFKSVSSVVERLQDIARDIRNAS